MGFRSESTRLPKASTTGGADPQVQRSSRGDEGMTLPALDGRSRGPASRRRHPSTGPQACVDARNPPPSTAEPFLHAWRYPRPMHKRRHGDIPSGAHGAQAAPRRRAADVAERLRSLEREKRVADALVQVAEQAGAGLALTDVLGRFCRLTVELVPCDRCTIYLWSSRRKAYIPVADCGTPAHVVPRFAERYYYRGKMFFEDDLRAGKTVRLSRERELSPEEYELIEESEQYDMAIVPLQARGMGIGSMSVGLHQAPGFDATSLTIVHGVARQAAARIDNARLFDRVQKAASIRAGLASLAAALNEQSDPETIARLVCSEAAALLGVSGGLLFLRNQDELVAVGGSGWDEGGIRGLRVPPANTGEHVVLQAYERNATVFENEVAASPMAHACFRSEERRVGKGGTSRW